jgi:hypothetical protein
VLLFSFYPMPLITFLQVFKRLFQRYFCSMARLFICLTLLFLPAFLRAQVRVTKLVIRPNETYELNQTDILVADTLIMMDSSRLVLNKLKKENYIRAQVAIFGNYCVIDGKGLNGGRGKDGLAGMTPIGPCKDGTPGRNGGKGLDGTPGIDLFLYLEDVNIKGRLVIDLSGGNGGKGGNGGGGGGGSPGTLHCNGGNGANGGNAGQGGNGANGGALTITSKKNPTIQNWVGSKIMVYNYGGLPGERGIAGYHGAAGLGPSRKNGKNGEPGLDARNGLAGLKGAVNFESN